MSAGWRLLLIHDDPEVSRLLAEHFLGRGSEVLACACEGTAIDAVKHHHFDAALIDRWLTTVTSLDLVRTLKRADPTLPVVLLDDIPDESSRQQARSAGADYCLPCCYSLVSLDAAVATVARPSSVDDPRHATARALKGAGYQAG